MRRRRYISDSEARRLAKLAREIMGPGEFTRIHFGPDGGMDVFDRNGPVSVGAQKGDAAGGSIDAEEALEKWENGPGGSA
jgi:hypothetical protein